MLRTAVVTEVSAKTLSSDRGCYLLAVLPQNVLHYWAY